MKLNEIRAIAHPLRKHGVAMVEVRTDAASDSARGPAADRTCPVVTSGMEQPGAPEDIADTIAVKSAGHGIARRTHPSRPDDGIAFGARVNRDQPLLYLENGLILNSVESPCDGVVEAMMVEEGARVDYAMPRISITVSKQRDS